MLASIVAMMLLNSEPPKLLDGAVTTYDYPPTAMREGRQGLSVISITITRDGRATDCSIHQSSGSPDLDARACEVTTTRTRFTPARGERGEPIDMAVRLPIRWVLQ